MTPADIRRGDIWWADLPAPVGSSPGWRRPVLVVQHDAFTRSRLATILVVALTSNVALADAPGNALLPAHATGLPRDSVANVTQVLTLDRRILVERVGAITGRHLGDVERGLRLALKL